MPLINESFDPSKSALKALQGRLYDVVTTYFSIFYGFHLLFPGTNMEYLVKIDKQYDEVSVEDFDFKTYYVSIVPGRSLMCGQVRSRVR